MAKRASNKDRIQQKAEEAAAGKKAKTDKKEKTVKKKATPRKKAATISTRKKLVWKVFDSSYKEVACFPYPEKNEAYTAMEALIQKKGKLHFVNSVSVPMEDE